MHSAFLELSGLGSIHAFLLNSNLAPSETETIFVRSTISRIDARLAAIDREISRLETEKASLSVLRAETQAILSPIRKIPPEILADIFLWTLPLSREVSPNRQPQSPWVLTRVSSRWREIAISTPSLWSRIVVSYIRGHAWSLAAVKTQIQRARGLKIWFIPSRTLDPAPQVAMLQLLVEQSARWEEAVLGLTRPLLPVLAAIRGRLPLLCRLWLQWDDDHTIADMDSIDAFSDVPRLLQLCVVEDFTSSIPFPVHQLTHYDLNCPMWMHMQLLSTATNLVHARMIGEFTGFTDENLVLPSLRRVYVHSIQILHQITAPSLDDLGFWMSGADALDPLPYITALIERSSCPLVKLVVCGAPQSTLISPILRALPQITDLTLAVSIRGHNHQLNALMSTLPLAPPSHLNSLSLGTDFPDGIDYWLFATALESTSMRELKRASLVSSQKFVHLPPTFWNALTELRRGGLDILTLEGEEGAELMDEWACHIPFY